MSKETLEFIQRKTGMVYSDEQAALIDSKGGACVLACAGSGKTTALTHMIARRLIDKEITSGRRILGVTFSKTGATEMDERLEELLDLLDIPASVKMKTLHAFCLEFLKNIGAMQGRAVIPEYEKLDAIQKIGRTQTRNWKYEDAEVIAGLITLQRGSLRSRENFINSTDFRISGIESLKYVTVYDGYTKYKAENNVIDFDDMLLLAHLKLKQSPFYGEKFMDTYQCILVDEAQDMSKLQYKIVLQLLGSDAVSPAEHEDHVRKTLVLIGDDDQCIYEWMGSEPQELAKVKDAYRLPLYTLSTNYRCPANVLSAAARCISNNTHSIPKSMNAHKPDGVLRYDRVRGGGFAAESKYVADCIAKQLDAGVAPSSIAVLARNAAHLSLVWLYLSCYGIKSRLYGGNSSGPDSLIKHIGECFRLYQSSADAGNVLYALFGGNKQSSEKLATLINLVDGTFMEWLEYIVATYIPGYKDVMSEDNAYANAGKMWKNSMKEYYTSGGLSRKSNSMQNLLRLYKAGKTSEVAFYQEVLDIYKDMMDWKFKTDDSIRIFLGTISAIKDLLDRYAEKAIPVLTTIGRHRAPNKHFVTLSTAHSAKGREWNTVYILCDDIYAFPSQVSIDILSSMGDPKAVKNFIEAERRLHYVAMTRARETLHIVGGDIPPGMFLQEALSDEEALRNGFDSRELGTDVTVEFKYSDTDYSKYKFRESSFIRDEDPEEEDADDDEDFSPTKRDYSMHDLDI